MTIRLLYAAAVGQFEKAFREIELPISRAATLAMDQAVDLAIDLGRANIGGQGFNSRWRNSLRGKVYPANAGQFSMRPTGWVYHKIPYAGVFEQPTTIAGDMWLRLPNAPQKEGRTPLTPELIRERFGDILKPARIGSKRMLVARIPLPRNSDPTRVKITTTMLRSAIQKNGSRPLLPPSGKKATRIQSVALFHGVNRVRLRRRFDIAGAVQQAAGQIGQLYVRNFTDE